MLRACLLLDDRLAQTLATTRDWPAGLGAHVARRITGRPVIKEAQVHSKLQRITVQIVNWHNGDNTVRPPNG